MDVSNPVVDQERVSYEDFQQESAMLVRQDYEKLKRMIEGGTRRLAPETTPRHEVPKNTIRTLEKSSELEVAKGELDLSFLFIEAEEVQVSKWHPQGRFMQKSHVHVIRNYPQIPRDTEVLQSLLTFAPDAAPVIESTVYTGGTKSGFSYRLREWAGRKQRPMAAVYKKHGLNIRSVLEYRLPINPKALPNWVTTTLEELLAKTTINRSSSAGPPLFLPKNEVSAEIDDMITEIVDAARRGPQAMGEWASRNMEAIVSECKNKTDRYDAASVHKKTRPYWSFSAAFQQLFSCLCQPFTTSLALFTEEPSSWNAYGFSWAHGGAGRLWEWMLSTKEGEKKCAIYGDDVKLVWRQGGQLWEVNPDFRQMDGSIDEDTVDATLDYLRDMYRERAKGDALTGGKQPFWEGLIETWKDLAVSGPFMVDGSRLYNTKHRGGLRTGICGTTLFDTVKSILAYELLIHNKIHLDDPEACTHFLRLECGLEVKEGTWNPVRVEEATPDHTWEAYSAQKFLGAQIVRAESKNGPRPVPGIPEEDLLKLIGNCRTTPERQRGTSGTTLWRKRFDMARGYMVTGAYQHPRIWSAMADLINRTPATVAVQRVQVGGGKGSKPELEMMVGEDFEWPSSDGFPTVGFCLDVFLKPQDKSGESIVPLYPELERELNQFRRQKARMKAAHVRKEKGIEAGGSWAAAAEPEEALAASERLVEKLQKELERRTQGEVSATAQEAAPLEPVRLPKARKWIRYKPEREQTNSRLQRLVALLGGDPHKLKGEKYEGTYDAISVHNQTLTVATQSGDYWLTQSMLALGWKPSAGGEWFSPEAAEEECTPLDPKNIQRAAWPYEARRALGLHYGTEVQGEPSAGTSSGPAEAPVEEGGKVEAIAAAAPPKVLPPPGMDDVSYVHSWYINSGRSLTCVSSVLAQSPNPRVRVDVKLKDTGELQVWGVSTNKVLAKAKAYGLLRKDLEALLQAGGAPPAGGEGVGE